MQSIVNGTVSNSPNENGAVYTLLGYTTAQNSVSVGGGYYDIASNNDGSANMMYTDFATAHRSYLFQTMPIHSIIQPMIQAI